MSSSDSPPGIRPGYLLPLALLLVCAVAGVVAYIASGAPSGRDPSGTGTADPFKPSALASVAEPDVVLYVSRAGEDSDNDCTGAARPCRSLARAIKLSLALAGDKKKQIKLGRGELEIGCNHLSGARNLRITGEGPKLTVLRGPFPGGGGNRPCALLAVSGEEITLEGFTLAGIADHTGDGIGVRVNGPAAGVLLQDLRFDGRALKAGRPGAMGLQLNGAPGKEARGVTVLRSQFLGFSAKAGILVKGPMVALKVYSSVFYGNDRGIGISSDQAFRGSLRVTVENCIFHKNVMGISAHSLPSEQDVYHLDYNLFGEGGSERVPRGSHDIHDKEPRFVDPPRDFSLQSTAGGHKRCSPAIDRGDPAHDHAREPAPSGGRINLGINGNTAAAARSCR